MSSISRRIPFTVTATEDEFYRHRAKLLSQVSAAIACSATFFSLDDDGNYRGRIPGSTTIRRKRRNMDTYIGRMDDRHFRRKYRMDKEAFWMLLEIIEDHLPSTGEKRKLGAVPNGPISKAARLSMALRYFAGGDPLDISDFHGVHDDEVLRSVWFVVDAIHASPELNIKFPESHMEQAIIMDGFKSKSAINIDCCVGAIDGMLVWINKPTIADQQTIGFGPKKFFCGRKMKYGLNMMGVCDSQRRFIWVEVAMPGAASNFYAFDQSSLKSKLETEGFLRPGSCLFGDNAYVNSPYMCVPWRNVSRGPKDAMNYFHSSLRICIECAFGILVHRWGILRKPMPVNLTVQKISSLVLALCKLHNFCIDTSGNGVDSPEESDIANIAMEGGLFLPRMDNNKEAFWEYDTNVYSQTDRLNELLDGGAHMDDHTRCDRRRYRSDKDLPCHRILEYCMENDLQRPDFSTTRLRREREENA